MGIGVHIVPHELITYLYPPDSGQGHEETLIWRISIDPDCVLPLLRQFKGVIGNGDSPVVGSVLPNGKGTLDGDAIQNCKAVVTLDQLLGLGLELFQVLLSPPIV